ncbi:hypothetical protein VTK26DRAFT_8257 [Humicola hyalothermophila]
MHRTLHQYLILRTLPFPVQSSCGVAHSFQHPLQPLAISRASSVFHWIDTAFTSFRIVAHWLFCQSDPRSVYGRPRKETMSVATVNASRLLAKPMRDRVHVHCDSGDDCVVFIRCNGREFRIELSPFFLCNSPLITSRYHQFVAAVRGTDDTDADERVPVVTWMRLKVRKRYRRASMTGSSLCLIQSSEKWRQGSRRPSIRT